MATHADAEIVLKLYDLRREEVMRKARHFVGFEFWPANADEFKQVHNPTNPNNAYWRQVITFWEMAAQLPLHGAVDTDLFLSTQGEALFIRAKFADLSEEATGNTFMPNVKKLIDGNEKAQAQFEAIKKNMLARREQLAAAKA